MLNLTNIKLEFTPEQALELKSGIEKLIEIYCLTTDSIMLDNTGKTGLYHVNKLSNDLTLALLGEQ